jgi:predicted CoA-binding protein
MNPPDAVLRALLARVRTIAVVGLSDKPGRDSNMVARYLQGVGYRIVPVNPNVADVLGERSYPSVTAIPASVSVDLVDVFRRSDQVLPTVDEAIQRRAPAVWMQLGVANAEAAARAHAAGMTVVEDRCIMREHERLHIAAVGATP